MKGLSLNARQASPLTTTTAMNIWNIVFLVLIFVLSIAVLALTSFDMQIRKVGGESIASLEKSIKTEQENLRKVMEGSAPDKPTSEKRFDEMGLDEQKVRLLDLLYERKKAWFGCQPQAGSFSAEGKALSPEQLGNENPATPGDQLKTIQLVEVRITITGPIVEQNGNEEVIPPDDLKGLVYVFDEGQEGVGGSFLGRFMVSQAPQKAQNGYQATLTVANELNEAEVQRIQRALRSTWAIYATVPMDRFQGLFDRITPEEAETWIPAAQRNKLMNPDRPLKDFDVLLTLLYDRRVVLKQDIDLANRAIQSLNTDREAATKEDQALRNAIEFEKKRIEAMENQRKTLQTKVEQYATMIEDIKSKIDETQKQNEWYLTRIADYQLQVKELIEQKAEEAAQNTEGVEPDSATKADSTGENKDKAGFARTPSHSVL